MTDGELTAAQIAALTASVDIDAPPPETGPSALVLFGTNQAAPARIAAARFHRGLAPLIIATGGINRHDGIVEGREFARQLAAAGVPASAVRVEDQSKDTWQNVELSLPYLREALAMGLPLVAVSKWYHLRAVYFLRTQLPQALPLYAIGWEPVYAGTLVTRDNWPSSPDGRRRVIRESQEVPRRVAEGSYLPAIKKDGAWSLCHEPLPSHRRDPELPRRNLKALCIWRTTPNRQCEANARGDRVTRYMSALGRELARLMKARDLGRVS
jgi:DUF218 domain